MSSEFDQENLISFFINEASDGMKTLTNVLNPAEDGLPTPQQLQEHFIVAHRIKGAAALYGYNGIACLCERLEALCEKAAAIPENEWPRAVGSMRKTVHGIQTLIQTIGSGGSEDRTVVAKCLASSVGLLLNKPTPSVSMPEATGGVLNYVTPMIDTEILSYFAPEAEEYLAVIEGFIPALRADPANKNIAPLLYRTIHTLKVSADTVKFQVVGDIAQKMVDCLRAVQEQRIPLSSELLDSFMHAVSLVRLLLRRDPTTIGRLQSDAPALISILGWFCDSHASVESSPLSSEPDPVSNSLAAEIAAEPEFTQVHSQFIELDNTNTSGAEAKLPISDAAGWLTESPAPAPEGFDAALTAEPESVQDQPPLIELDTIDTGRAETDLPLPTAAGWLIEPPAPTVPAPTMPAVSPEYIAPIIDAEVLSHFIPEAEEYLTEIEGLIQTLCAEATDDAIHSFALTAHTLKDLADTVGFQVIGDIAQRMNDCMGAVQEQRIPLSGELLDSFMHAVSLVRLLLRRDLTAIGQLQSDVPALISIFGCFCDSHAIVESPSTVSEPAPAPEGFDAALTAEPESMQEQPPLIELDTIDTGRAEAEPPIPDATDWLTEPPASASEGLDAALTAEPESVQDQPPLIELDTIDTGRAETDLPLPAAADWLTEPPAPTVPAPTMPAVSPEYIAPIIDAEVLSYFLPEAEEYLAAIEGLIPTLRADPTNEDAIHRLFRAAHTLKGSAYTVEFQVIGDIAHPMEDCMIAVRERRIPLSDELLDSFVLMVTLIRLLLQRDAAAVEQLQTDVPALIAILGRLCDGQPTLAPSAQLSMPNSFSTDAGDSLLSKAAEPAVPAVETLPSQSDDYFLPQLDPEVLSYFVPEAEEYLETLEANFLRLDKDTQNRELINQLFRTAHTLKGSAYTVGFQAIGDLIHHVENFMGAVRDSRLSVMPGHTDLILRAIDVVYVLMRRNPSTVDITRQRFQKALSELKQLEQGHAVEVSPPAQSTGETVQQPERPPDHEENQEQVGKQAEGRTGEEREFIRVSYARLEQLMNLVGELVIGRGRLDQRLRTLERLSDQVLACKARMLDSVQSFADKHTFTFQSAPSGPEAKPAHPETREFGDFGSLELDKYDDFNILARRIGEVSADITESMAQLSGSIRRAQEDMNSLQQLTRTMRDEIGRASMVPVGTPFTRFRRAIREIARALDKQVSLVTSGEHTEVDTGIVEGLVDPLVHLVRNAVYHGIETPAERVANGKPSAGTIYLHAAHRGNSIVLEVEDDGAGLNLAKIREKAVAIGMATHDQVQAMSDSDALQFIFAPGFSTAEKVGDQAGRGVGLDVVKRTIESMNGHIEVESQPGIGTKFTLSLPLTLLITTALLVRAGSEQYAIALSNIREVTLPTATSLAHAEDRTLLHLEEEVIEVQSLHRILHRELTPVSVTMPIVIVRTATGLLGLAVDELLGRQEIVIKRLGSLKPLKHSCFAGATIDPEGRVVLVLDPTRLKTDQSMQSAAHHASSPKIPSPNNSMAEPTEDTRTGILLIDDSLSIRKFVGRMLESAGYSVDTAVDGDDGIRKASETAYRVIITDLEMPKFNGYEVVQALRARPQTQQTPIIVITTRAGDKHRQLALDIGANSYIAKPVNERTLLDEIERWTGTPSAHRK